MNSSLDNRQRAPNLLIFSSCAVLVPLFQCTQKEWQEKVFVGVLKAIDIMGWKAFTAKGIINLLFYPCFHSKLCLWVVLGLEFH